MHSAFTGGPAAIRSKSGILARLPNAGGKIGHFKVVADQVFNDIGIDALNGPTLRDSWPVTADLRPIETGTDLPSEIGERSALADQQDSKKNAEH